MTTRNQVQPGQVFTYERGTGLNFRLAVRHPSEPARYRGAQTALAPSEPSREVFILWSPPAT